MFLHEFGEDFVLALQLLFQQGDPPVLVVAGAAGAVLECGSGVLEELLLPTVEHRGVNAVLVAQIRHRGVFEEMEPKYGDLLRGAEAIPSFLGHGKTPARDCSVFERLVLPIPTEAKQVVGTYQLDGSCHLGRTFQCDCISAWLASSAASEKQWPPTSTNRPSTPPAARRNTPGGSDCSIPPIRFICSYSRSSTATLP